MQNSIRERFQGYDVLRRTLQVAGRPYTVIGPDHYESLLDDPRVAARFDVDEYMPYWAEFWPACLLLADHVAAWEAAPADKPPLVLELGCGLGLVSLVAVARGYRVIASDYDNDALAFVAESARRSQLSPPETRYIDWRQHYPDLRVDRLVAAEVLYEARHLEPIATFIREHLTSEGFAVICDRNRSTADPFPDVAQAAGLTVTQTPVEQPGGAGELPIAGRLFTLTRS